MACSSDAPSTFAAASTHSLFSFTALSLRLDQLQLCFTAEPPSSEIQHSLFQQLARQVRSFITFVDSGLSVGAASGTYFLYGLQKHCNSQRTA